MPADDASGVEPLAGESEAEYVARQARLREEAAARMRAKFGASGGLNGGVRMGGIGSDAPGAGRSSSGELLSKLGSAATSAGWLLGSAAAAAASAAASAKDSAKEKLASARESYRQPQGAFDTSGLASLSRNGSSGRGVEDSTDISDLLGACGLDRAASSASASAQPLKSAAPAAGAAAARADHWGGDDSWGAAPAITAPTVPADALPPLTKAAPAHYSGGGGGGVARRKVAAVKASSDGWDDWGNDKW